MSMHKNKSTMINQVLPLIASLYSEGIITSEQRINLTRLARSALADDSTEFFEYVCDLEQIVPYSPTLSELRDIIILA